MKTLRIGVLVAMTFALAASLALASPTLVTEVEDNDTVAQATALPSGDLVALGSIYPQPDTDYWKFTANAGDRIYAATMTSASASANFDTILDLVSSNGVTILETDDNDGSLGGGSSSIAGKLIPTTGTYYLKVTAVGFVPLVQPYQLSVRVQRAAPTPETEPNSTTAAANPIPASGHVSGVHLAGDTDWFSVTLNAGDSVYLGLDADPERNTLTWNPRLAFGLLGDAGDQVLAVDDAATASPNSEALFATVQNAGTYYVRVDSAASPGGVNETYNLSVSIHPNTAPSPVCTTYQSVDTPIAIADGSGPVTSTIVVPGHPRIFDLNVSIQLTHQLMADIDAHLVAPVGNDVGLFTDIGATSVGGQIQMDLILDDEAATAIESFPVLKGLAVMPERRYRLGWFDGEDAGGAWTLKLWDDAANGSSGTLNGWSLTICEPPPAPVCVGTLVTVYASDFETGDGGFTHSGTLDQWARGLPQPFPDNPIVSCNSGTNCWKTNLTDNYADNALMLLQSPPIDLAGLIPPIRASWAQAYQMDNSSFDRMEVDIDDFNTALTDQPFVWLDAAQDDDVGVGNATYIAESAGWGIRTANLDASAGNFVQITYGLSSDGFVGYSGLAIDDVLVTGCCTPASCNDLNPCTSDTCSPTQGCVHAPLTGNACDDGNPCTVDTCNAGTCFGALAPVIEINASVTNDKSGTTSFLQWSDPPGSYNVYRGSRSAAPFAYNHTCFQSALAASPSTDTTVPLDGTLYYYLVTRKNTCGESIPGRDSAGAAIPLPSTCP